MEYLDVRKITSKTFNPSARKQLKKIIDSIEITWSTFPTRHARGRPFMSHDLHIIFHLKNSKWQDTHLYFSDLQYDMKYLKKIEYEFQKMKDFFDEVEP